MKVLVTGASGYVGSKLIPALRDQGVWVRASARRHGFYDVDDFVAADMLTGSGLRSALAGIDVAFYLVHSMASGGDFTELDSKAARNFASEARACGVRRIVYLGGLGGDDPDSEHLRSRHQVSEILAGGAPQFVYARAAVVLGSGSASFLMLKHLVHRLPLMVCPRWVDVKTQPIAVSDLISSLVNIASLPEISGPVELGGRDVVTYRQMMLSLAEAEGRRKPLVIPVPVLTPKLSSYWVGFVTDVNRSIAKPLIEGLKAETIVRIPPPPGINDHPLGIDAAMREALEEAS